MTFTRFRFAIAILAILILPLSAAAASLALDLHKTDTTGSATFLDAARALYLAATPRPVIESFALPEAGTCSFTTLACNTSASGSFGIGDCTLDSDGTYVDFWTFSGTAGHTVTVTMRSSSFDSYLVLFDPDANIVRQDNNSGGGLDARITYTLNASGTWAVAANQVIPASGSYTISLQCEGDDGGDCTPQVRQTSCGLTVTGTVDLNDCDVEGIRVEFWTFTGVAGQSFTAAMTRTAGSGDVGLVVFHDDGTELGSDMPAGSSATVTGKLPKSGTWVIAALATSSVNYSLATGCQTQSSCASTTDNLCLNDNRFRVNVAARDPRTGKTGTGRSVPYNNISGFFSLPALTGDTSNFEVFVKILDGRPVNGRWWVFYGGLTDFEYTISVTDSLSGQSKTYYKPGLQYVGGADVSAFQ